MNKYVGAGVLALLTGVGLLSSAHAAKTTILHRFDGSDGTNSATALTLGADGRLYGTTIAAGQFNRGTVFAIDPSTGEFATLHHFTGEEGSDPFGQLLLASDGNFYGTTRYGGDPNCPSGCGTIYRISPTGEFTQLHVMTFLEGTTLQGGLVEGTDGRLYGTATLGGRVECHGGTGAGCGTVYAFLRTDSSVSVIHKFNFADGGWPYGRVVLASNGYLYGTTSSGAAGEAGTVYRVKPSGKGFKTLVEFAGTTAGCQPKAGLIQAGNGSLYGVTEDCGNYNSGAIYMLSPHGDISTIHRFDPDGYARDGKNSTAELLQAPDGKLYGTTRLGGLPVDADREGTVFSIALNGTKYTLLHTFMGSPDGAQPTSGLTLGADKNVYGVTPVGGAHGFPGNGTVYKVRTTK